MSGESTPGATGALEVYVDGDIVHSKLNGDGYIDSSAKLLKIIGAVEAKL